MDTGRCASYVARLRGHPEVNVAHTFTRQRVGIIQERLRTRLSKSACVPRRYRRCGTGAASIQAAGGEICSAANSAHSDQQRKGVSRGFDSALRVRPATRDQQQLSSGETPIPGAAPSPRNHCCSSTHIFFERAQ